MLQWTLDSRNSIDVERLQVYGRVSETKKVSYDLSREPKQTKQISRGSQEIEGEALRSNKDAKNNCSPRPRYTNLMSLFKLYAWKK